MRSKFLTENHNANGRWQMADGRWQMADGRWQTMIYYKCKHKFNVLLTRTVAHLSHVFSRVQCVKVVE